MPVDFRRVSLDRHSSGSISPAHGGFATRYTVNAGFASSTSDYQRFYFNLPGYGVPRTIGELQFRWRSSSDGGATWTAWTSVSTSSSLSSATSTRRVEIQVFRPPPIWGDFAGFTFDLMDYDRAAPLGNGVRASELHRISRTPFSSAFINPFVRPTATQATLAGNAAVAPYSAPTGHPVLGPNTNQVGFSRDRATTGNELPWYTLTTPEGASYMRTVGTGIRADILVAPNVNSLSRTAFQSVENRLVGAWFVEDTSALTNVGSGIEFDFYDADDVVIPGWSRTLFARMPNRGTVTETLTGAALRTDAQTMTFAQALSYSAGGQAVRTWASGYVRYTGHAHSGASAASVSYTRSSWDWDPGAQPIPGSWDPGRPLKDPLNDWLSHTITLLETTGTTERYLAYVFDRPLTTDTIDAVSIAL